MHLRPTRFQLSLLLLGLLLTPASLAQTQPQVPDAVIAVPNPPNTRAQQAKHYVVLVSLDGFRYDYATKYNAAHLLALAARGASAPEGMLPSYPSLTFPNHYSIVTGLYPEHHGIVANSFFDPARNATYHYNRSDTAADGSWYGGTPLWSLAEQQGMRTASIFWPASTAEIAGKRPSYYMNFDDKFDDSKRIDLIIQWLQLPPAQRPHFITLYYSNTDHSGHDYGPDSEETRDAVHHLDDVMGELDSRLRALKLPIDLIIVADHGMVTYKAAPVVLGDLVSLTGVNNVGTLFYPASEAETAKLFADLKEHAGSAYSVYRRADVPPRLHFNSNPREGDPVVVASPAINVIATAAAAENKHLGGHGFDPATTPEMKATFFAVGPDIKSGVKLPTFENVDLYPFIAHLLGLTAPPSDGTLAPLLPALSKK
jgi:predicted AlkP superfamily pyrophosphatase or phosphodiesterase